MARRRLTSSLCRWTVAVVLGLGLGLGLSAQVKAQTTATPMSVGPMVRGVGGENATDPFHGAYATSIPIDAPAFHGIEPRLSLGFNSSGGNGQTGVGWSLGGFSTIQRATPGKGAPRYNASDIYLLDGEELVPCAGGASPSCVACSGGTCYSTKTENYQRISFNGSAWTLTHRDGTQVSYAATLTTSAGTFRWGVSSVVDTKNNTVSYGWYSDGFDAYPDNVSYDNGAFKVQLSRTTRSDPIYFSTGKSVGKTLSRLSGATVSVSGSTVRSYKLLYSDGCTAACGSTSRSRLSSVQELGRDGVTALPAVRLAWADNDDGTYLSPVTVNLAASSYYAAMADVNGDGRTDLISKNTGDGFSTLSYVQLGNGDGTYTYASTQQPGGYFKTMADVNGDGKADLVFVDQPTRPLAVYIQLSNGDGTFGGTTAWTLSQGYFAGFADVNGDGKEDLITSDTGDGFATYVWVALAQGNAAFGNPIGTQLAGSFQYPADVNGDGRADLISTVGANQGGTQVYVQLANGDGTFSTGSLTNLGSNGYFYTVGDVNGDGLVDMASTTSCGAAVYIWFSVGDGTFTYGGAIQSGANGPGCYIAFADVNGDGKADAIGRSLDSSLYYVQISNGDGSFQPYLTQSLQATLTANTTYAPSLADVNGDGKMDIIIKPDNGFLATNLQVMVRAGTMRDAMTSIANGYGGTTTMEYTPSSNWPNVNNPPIVRTVTAITVDDANGNSARSTYTYKSGRYDRTERQFLGFGYAKHVLPLLVGETAPPYVETTFMQDIPSAGKPTTIERHAGDGTPLTSTVYQYLVNAATTPYTSQLISQTDYTFDRTYVRRVGQTFSYDTYGNVTTHVENGDLDISGDERTTQNNFTPNTVAFITGKPSSTVVYAGPSTAGTRMSQQVFYYDGNGSAGVTSAGLLTRTDSWLDVTNSYLTMQTIGYDGFGNITSRTDARGNPTTYQYDSTYNLFVVTTTNALNQVATTGWDAQCGTATRVTDANGTLACTQFDPLCRPVEFALSGDSLTNYGGGYSRDPACPTGGSPTHWTDYDDWGTVNQQRTVVHTKDLSTNGKYEKTFYDGLGRRIQTCANADPTTNSGGAAETCSSEIYDARANLHTTFAPFFHTSAGVVVTTAPSSTAYHQKWFDALGRVTQEQLMNNGSGVVPPTTTTYGVAAYGTEATVIDPRGFATITIKDAYGRVLSIQRQGGSAGQYGACSGSSCPTCSSSCAGKCAGASDGCGGICSVGCASGQVCNAGSCCSPVPASTACAGRNCGAVPDGCGGTIGCGGCGLGTICNSNGVCIACGASGQSCCSSGAACQSTSLYCALGTCQACGGVAQTCCPAPATACTAGVCTGGSCAACGAQGQHCCPSPQTACNAGSACSAGSCVGCGGPGQVLCPNAPYCNPGATPCQSVSCQSGTCVSCGGPGQYCCGSGAACNSGAYCSAGSCTACGGPGQACCPSPQPACNSGVCSASKCVACGAPGQVLCNTTPPCNPWATPCPNGSCQSGTCVSCGGTGQVCCASGAACQTGYACQSGGCQACGGIGQVYCPGATPCQQWATPCPNASCQSGTCVACGGPGQFLCARGAACQQWATPCNSVSCTSGTCVGCGAPGQTLCAGTPSCQPWAMPCNSVSCSSGTCIGCGSGGQSCCSGGSPCQTGYACNAGQCVCGNAGQSCCPGGQCNYPYICSGGACR